MELSDKNITDMNEARRLCSKLYAKLGEAMPVSSPKNPLPSYFNAAIGVAFELQRALEVLLYGAPQPKIAADSLDTCQVQGQDLYVAVKYLRQLATGQMGDAGGNALPQSVQNRLGLLSDRFVSAMAQIPMAGYVEDGPKAAPGHTWVDMPGGGQYLQSDKVLSGEQIEGFIGNAREFKSFLAKRGESTPQERFAEALAESRTIDKTIYAPEGFHDIVESMKKDNAND